MSNTAVPNDIEFDLVDGFPEENCPKEYKAALREAKLNCGDDLSFESVANWSSLIINSDCGNGVWKCPECKALHIFKKHGGEVKELYILDTEWKKEKK
jgi:hypothetical protein